VCGDRAYLCVGTENTGVCGDREYWGVWGQSLLVRGDRAYLCVGTELTCVWEQSHCQSVASRNS